MIFSNATYLLMKMKKCEECGKKLGILGGYCHPTLGTSHILCSPCFNQVSESVEKWREFVLSNSFNMRPSKNDSQLYWKKIIPNITRIWDIFQTESAEKEIDLKK